ncbi:hypothetical protein BDN70DRAFT_998856 [Pholiota conissans]|uniref:Uncharacterized protein n=1 Tax=Pholiota conissans TaxID=109636 RepID=A0A9P6CL39_9AGAR|nr:hypothetical protein BDN70DRAFT_998856 [Pholiota conissans]
MDACQECIDHLYGLPALRSGDGFTNAQSLLNAIETLMNLTYLYLAHVVQWPAATLVGFAAVVMTLSKTILYLAQEYYCGFCAVGHNKAWEFTVWLFPLVLWLVVSSMIVYQFGKDLAESLNIASQQSSKIASSKKQ